MKSPTQLTIEGIEPILKYIDRAEYFVQGNILIEAIIPFDNNIDYIKNLVKILTDVDFKYSATSIWIIGCITDLELAATLWKEHINS